MYTYARALAQLKPIQIVCQRFNSCSIDNQFRLRRAVDTDNVPLAQLNQQSFFETYVDDCDTPYSKDDIKKYFRTSVSPETFADKIADSKQAIWIVEDKTNDEIVAFANAGPYNMPLSNVQAENDGQFYRLYIQRDYQDYGLGHCLMKVALSWLEKQFPGRPIWLGVWSGNLKGQEFHKKYNFHKVDERYYQVGKFKRHSFVMRRDSSSS
ncbi:unnamed protein product [Adineta steineri]|uniref:N-acetyltransferase domain-containing protein n=2 Tax=Adineta steineri TaxID=433720 RepID=A0A818UNA0_9BILA|nr:unnamed protein product [Adineta steineri]